MRAKKEWAHQHLYKAKNTEDIWQMTHICKGHHTNLFPALRDNNNNLITKPEGKAALFCQCFFLANTCPVNTIQHEDPPPLETRRWTNISPEEVTEVLCTTLNASAPGPSRIGYTILKWAHAAHPKVLTIIFNLCLNIGKHLWNEATVVVLNKP
jgi:hypothetical protein